MNDLTRQFTLSNTLRTSILEYGLSDTVREVCGLLGGKGLNASTFYPIKNVATKPGREFFMDPEEQIDAIRRMRLAGESLVGIFHTHPDSPAVPSARDRELAAYPGTVYLILSLSTEIPRLKAYYYDGEKFGDELTISS